MREGHVPRFPDLPMTPSLFQHEGAKASVALQTPPVSAQRCLKAATRDGCAGQGATPGPPGLTESCLRAILASPGCPLKLVSGELETEHGMLTMHLSSLSRESRGTNASAPLCLSGTCQPTRPYSQVTTIPPQGATEWAEKMPRAPRPLSPNECAYQDLLARLHQAVATHCRTMALEFQNLDTSRSCTVAKDEFGAVCRRHVQVLPDEQVRQSWWAWGGRTRAVVGGGQGALRVALAHGPCCSPQVWCEPLQTWVGAPSLRSFSPHPLLFLCCPWGPQGGTVGWEEELLPPPLHLLPTPS